MSASGPVRVDMAIETRAGPGADFSWSLDLLFMPPDLLTPVNPPASNLRFRSRRHRDETNPWHTCNRNWLGDRRLVVDTAAERSRETASDPSARAGHGHFRQHAGSESRGSAVGTADDRRPGRIRSPGRLR